MNAIAFKKPNGIDYKIGPGDLLVLDSDEWITTVLGSCISVCIRDRKIKVGGINHFMLPETVNSDSDTLFMAARFGGVAMEQLINGIMSRGGRRENLDIKVFGGARIMHSDVGEQNIAFVKNYLSTEQLPVIAFDVGGCEARKIRYQPKTGKALVKYLPSVTSVDVVNKLSAEERAYQRSMQSKTSDSSIELF